MKALRFLPLLVLVIAIAVVGCGTALDDVTSTTTTEATTTSDATTTTTGAQATISDGEHFGFVRQVAEDALIFDPAEFLSGDAALAAARADGVIGADEKLPNDFYIDNPEKEEVRLEVDPAAKFILIVSSGTGDLAEKVVSYGELFRLWAGVDDTSPNYGFVVGELPMTMTISQARVTGGEQQYLP